MSKPKTRHKKQHRQLPPGMTYADVLAMRKEQVEAVRKAATDDAVQIRADIHTQKIMWLYVVSIADAYGFGPKRMEDFFRALQKNSDDFIAMREEIDEEYALEKLRMKAEAVTGASVTYVYEKELAQAEDLFRTGGDRAWT